MGDLMATGNNPGTTYTPSETNGVYHEDREVTLIAGGGSQMYRVYNAAFDFGSQSWNIQNNSFPAYATVQDSEGSIHYYTLNAEGQWEGSDNNTIYNAVDFGTTAGGSASSNSTALGSLFTSMVNAAGLGGGTARIPQYKFPINASVAGLTVPPGPSGGGLGGCIIQGLGTGGQSGTNKAFHFSITDPDDLGPFIFLNCGSAPHTSGGSFFKNLAFQWSDPGWPRDTCLYLNYWNNGVDSCTFTDCPTAMNIQGLAVSATRCTIDYGANITTPTAVNGIIMTGIQCEVSGPSEMNGGMLAGTTAHVHLRRRDEL